MKKEVVLLQEYNTVIKVPHFPFTRLRHKQYLQDNISRIVST